VHFFVLGIEADESPRSWTAGKYHLDLHITKAHLEIEITDPPPEGKTVSTKQQFPVVAEVTNSGLEPAAGVTVTVVISPTDSAQVVGNPVQSLDTITESVTIPVTWTLECSRTVPSQITVVSYGYTPDGTDGGVVPIPAANLITDSVTITQEEKIHLEVTDVSTDLPNGDVASTEQVFTVTATVLNKLIGIEDPELKAVAEDVTAVLEIIGGAEMVSGPSPTSVPTLTGGTEVIFTWTVRCTDTVPVEMMVTPVGIDENTGQPVLPGNIVTGALTITQEEKAHLVAKAITAPESVNVGTTFNVSAVVSNTGAADATGVTVTLSVTGGASLIEGETPERTIGHLSGGATSDPVVWTLRCTSAEDAVIRVIPAGIDVNTGSAIPEDNLDPDGAEVLQRFIIHLPLIFKKYTP